MRLDADLDPLLEPDAVLLAQLKLRMAAQEIAKGVVGTLVFAAVGASRRDAAGEKLAAAWPDEPTLLAWLDAIARAARADVRDHARREGPPRPGVLLHALPPYPYACGLANAIAALVEKVRAVRRGVWVDRAGSSFFVRLARRRDGATKVGRTKDPSVSPRERWCGRTERVTAMSLVALTPPVIAKVEKTIKAVTHSG